MIQKPVPLPPLPEKPPIPMKPKRKSPRTRDEILAAGETPAPYQKAVDIQKRLAGMSRGGIDYLEKLQEIAYDTLDASPAQRIEALKTLLAYQFGKPVTPTQIDGSVDVTHHIGEGMTEAELIALLAEPEGNDNEG